MHIDILMAKCYLVYLIYHALASSQSKYSKSKSEEWRGRRNEGERERAGCTEGRERGGSCAEGREGERGRWWQVVWRPLAAAVSAGGEK